MGDPCVPTTTRADDGASITCCAHGGQLLGWVPAGAEIDRLWLSPLHECGAGKAIRGGVPVVFPQFADRGPLPKHGVARDRAWQVVEQSAGTGPARWVARLSDDETTREIWPQSFTLQITVQAQTSELTIELAIRNEGASAFDFVAALHAYLRVGDPGRVTVEGLGGLAAENNAQDRAPMSLPAGPLPVIAPRDVAVLDVNRAVRVDDPVLGGLTVVADGFTDRVIWNPGPDAPGDVPVGGSDEFFCLEPAALTPVRLEPRATWTGTVRLVAQS